jgi:peptidoglycan/LPS O-acetylase OafA/YrhL
VTFSSTSHYFPHVDGLRAAAVLAVIVYHLNPAWMPGGFAGVDVFFVISGYVVTASLASRADATLQSFITGFYGRRLTRVAPALLVMLLVSVLGTVLFIPEGWLSGLTEGTAKTAFFGFSNITLASNSEAYFTPRAEFNAFTHTWSLGVEEQFYLVVPIILYGWFKARPHNDKRALIFSAVLLVIAIASLAYAAWAQKHAPTVAFYSLPSRFWELAIGALLFQLSLRAVHANNATPPARWLSAASTQWATSIAGVALLILSYVALSAAQFPWPNALLPTIAAALLIGVHVNTTPVDWPRQFFSQSVIVWIGLRSYSLYLWHWPIFVLMRWTVGVDTPALQLVALAMTFCCAEFSYRCIETPIRRSAFLSKRKPAVRVAMLVTAIVIGAGIAQLTFSSRAQLSLSTVTRNASQWYASDRMSGFEAQRRCAVDLKYRTVEQTTVIEYHPRDCKLAANATANAGVNASANVTANAPNIAASPNKQLFVLGDSHATAYLMMFDQIAAELGMIVRVYQVPGCPFLDLFAPMGEGRPALCVTQARVAQADVAALANAADIVFLASLRLRRFSDQWARFDEHQSRDAMISEAALAVRARANVDAMQWLEPFFRKDLHVLFDLPKPIFKSPPMRCSDTFNQMNAVCSGSLSMLRTDLERYRAPAIASIEFLKQKNPLVASWDPFPVLCPGDTCKAIEATVPHYYDGDHLSAAGNKLLFPSFRQAICARLPASSCER